MGEEACTSATTGSVGDAVDALRACIGYLAAGDGDPWGLNLTLVLGFGAALIALVGALVAVYYQYRASREQQLWNRMEWAFEQTWDAQDDQVMTGLLALQALIDENDRSGPIWKRLGKFRISAFDLELIEIVADVALSNVKPPSHPAGGAS